MEQEKSKFKREKYEQEMLKKVSCVYPELDFKSRFKVDVLINALRTKDDRF